MRGGAFEVDVSPSLTPVSAGTIADAAFELFRKAGPSLLVLSAGTNLPLFAGIAGLVLFIRERGWTWGSPEYFVPLAAIAVAIAIAAWLRALGTGAMAHACAAAAEGRPAGPASALRAALGVGAALPLACALRLAGAAIGLAACLLPGVTIVAGLAFVPHAILFERRGVAGAAMRSLSLAGSGAMGLIAVGFLAVSIYLVGFLQLILAARLAEALVALALPSLGGGWLSRPEAPWAILAATKILADPLVSAGACAAWMDSRIRSDGTDLDLRVQHVAGEIPSLASEGA